jgi:hypothetical protein
MMNNYSYPIKDYSIIFLRTLKDLIQKNSKESIEGKS